MGVTPSTVEKVFFFVGREQCQAILLPLLAYVLFDFQKEFTISLRSKSLWGFPAGTSGKEPACQCRRLKRCRFDPWVRKIPWRRAWQPTPVSLPGESHRQRSLADYSPWGRKAPDMTE